MGGHIVSDPVVIAIANLLNHILVSPHVVGKKGVLGKLADDMTNIV